MKKIGDLYYLYYSVSQFGSQTSAIGYATSSTLEYGSWTDHGATGVASSSGKDYNAIDANLISSGSNWYMNFGSFWGDIHQAPMGADGKKVTGSSVQIQVSRWSFPLFTFTWPTSRQASCRQISKLLDWSLPVHHKNVESGLKSPSTESYMENFD